MIGRRTARAAVVAVALVLLVSGLWSGAAVSRARAQRALDVAAMADAGERANALDEYFSRARSVLLLAAQNPAFRDFYDAPREVRLRDGGAELDDAIAQMRYLHSLYPDSIGEICFIDRRGPENARLVRGAATRVGDLSLDERGNRFFGPTLTVPVGEVLQAAPYVSPDTGNWVISNSTPLVGRDGAVTAMLHYEVSLDSFRSLIARVGGVERVQLVDELSHRLVADTAEPVAEASTTLPAAGPLPPSDDRVDVVDHRRIAHAGVTASDHNENRWLVLVEVPAASPQMGGFLNGTTLALVAVALLLLMLTYLGARARRLQVVAHTDGLTGLANRRAFAMHATRALDQAARTGSLVAIGLVDLDRFKEVNDTLGHAAGDELLRLIAERLLGALRAGDTVARVGGDEFAVVFADVASIADAVEFARGLADVLRDPVRLNEVTFALEASVGVAISGSHGDDVEVLLQHADGAMYAAKRQHTGIAVFDPLQDVHRPEQLALLGELRTAIETRNLSVHYQPKVDLRSGAVVGVEALVRWPHPRLGLLMPAAFVDLAERSTLMEPLTRLVLDVALEQCRRWSAAGLTLTVAVNTSPRSLRDPLFARSVLDAVARSGVHPCQLVLELTESAIMTDPATASTVLGELHRAGVQISIDDFGTGYSSLAYLQTLPLDELKIDRSFVARLDDHHGTAIVRSVIDLARNLGLRVVAEGVETEASREILRTLSCDVGQGYLWTRPVAADELTAWLTAMVGAGRDTVLTS